MLDITEDALEELITTYARHNATTTDRTPNRSLRRYRNGFVRDTAAADRAGYAWSASSRSTPRLSSGVSPQNNRAGRRQLE